ncbi:LOW QUALITY PROTEIN: coiled-coil domain-containing protein 78 [Lycodopsis pacificus]
MDTNHKTPNELEERLIEENLQLRGKHERLFTKVGYLESRPGHLACSNTDLSCRLVRSEEEQLKGTWFHSRLLGNHDEIKDMLEKMKNSYEEQRKKLEEKVVAMGKEHQENKRATRNRQQELSEQSAALMCSQSQVKEVEEENSKLQLHLKELNQEYRARLVCYLRDLAEYVDGLGEGKSPSETSKMRAHVDSMLQDVRSSEQLAHAARSYKKRLQKVAKTHHALLIAYRVQRDQVLAQMGCGLDPGPPEASFSLEPTELRGEPEKEVHHLRQERLECQLQAARKQDLFRSLALPLQVAVLEMPVQNASRQEPACEESWSDTRKQLREIADSTLAGFEKERALLLTRATVAEAQVWELQDYIDPGQVRKSLDL